MILLMVFSLLLSGGLFAGELGRDLPDILDEHAQYKEDLGILEGLVLAASMIKATAPGQYLIVGKDVQYMTQVNCQYEVSCLFADRLSEVILNIKSPDLRAELSGLELNLKEVHKNNSPYQEKWPSNSSACLDRCRFYQELFSTAHEKINQILTDYRESLPAQSKQTLKFIEESLDAKQLEADLADELKEKLVQLSLQEKSLSVLENQIKNRVDDRQKLDQQIARLKQLRSSVESEVANVKLRLSQLNSEYQQKKQELELELEEFEKKLNLKREIMGQQMGELSLTLAEKKQEFESFKVTLSSVLEASFPSYTNQIKFDGLNQESPIAQKMISSMTRTVHSILPIFESSSIGEEKAVPFTLKFRFLQIRNKTGFLASGFYSNVLISVEVNLRYQKETIYSDNLSIELDADGEFKADKSRQFVNELTKLFRDDIPKAQKKVYSAAQKFEHRQQLDNLCFAVHKANPISCISLDVMPSAPQEVEQVEGEPGTM